MKLPSLALLALCLAPACATTPPPPATEPPATPAPEAAPSATPSAEPAAPGKSGVVTPPPPPPEQSRRHTSQEWERLVASGAYTPTTLSPVGPRRELSMGTTVPAPAPGLVRATSCQPGGPSEGFVTERAGGALWRLRTIGGLSVPAGVQISATRCFAAEYELPFGVNLAGTIEVTYPSKLGR
jgi:hypothetical protein